MKDMKISTRWAFKQQYAENSSKHSKANVLPSVHLRKSLEEKSGSIRLLSISEPEIALRIFYPRALDTNCIFDV